jgi:hypothetical protein
MSTYFPILILIAENERTRQMMQALRSARNSTSSNSTWLGLMILMAALLAFVALAIIVQRQQRQRKVSCPRSLFFEICRAHRLTWFERRLLWRLARSQKLADPARLFLSPECFEIGSLTVALRSRAEELRKLSERIFLEPLEEKKSDPTAGTANFIEEEKRNAALSVPPLPPTLELPQWGANINVEN